LLSCWQYQRQDRRLAVTIWCLLEPKSFQVAFKRMQLPAWKPAELLQRLRFRERTKACAVCRPSRAAPPWRSRLREAALALYGESGQVASHPFMSRMCGCTVQVKCSKKRVPEHRERLPRDSRTPFTSEGNIFRFSSISTPAARQRTFPQLNHLSSTSISSLAVVLLEPKRGTYAVTSPLRSQPSRANR
jgi:hypothetical protein